MLRFCQKVLKCNRREGLSGHKNLSAQGRKSIMADKNIKNTKIKKKKKTADAASSPSASRPVIVQPEVVKKKKKPGQPEQE
jgi:hypothetical protein